MVQVTVYAGSFVFTVVSTVLNLVALNRRSWLVYKAPASIELQLKTVWGLFEVCTYGPNNQRQCRDFPVPGTDCTAGSKTLLEVGAAAATEMTTQEWHRPYSFCDHYRTAGYAAQLAAVFGCAALISHIIIVSRGRKFRDFGWKVLVGFICANALCQIITTGYIVHLRNTTSSIFPPGTRLSSAFVLSQISWVTDILLAIFLVIAGVLAARRGDGYKSIPGTPVSRRSRRFSDDNDDDDD